MGKFVVRALIDFGLVAAGFVAGVYAWDKYIDAHPEEKNINSDLHYNQTEAAKE